jgi:hypothetical protein
MFPPIEHETRSIVVYEDAKTDTVRALIRETPFRERAMIKDLLRLEHYAINQIHDTREAMDLRRLTERYPEHAEAIFAQAEQPIEPSDERDLLLSDELRIAQPEHILVVADEVEAEAVEVARTDPETLRKLPERIAKLLRRLDRERECKDPLGIRTFLEEPLHPLLEREGLTRTRTSKDNERARSRDGLVLCGSQLTCQC